MPTSQQIYTLLQRARTCEDMTPSAARLTLMRSGDNEEPSITRQEENTVLIPDGHTEPSTHSDPHCNEFAGPSLLHPMQDGAQDPNVSRIFDISQKDYLLGVKTYRFFYLTCFLHSLIKGFS